MKYVSALGIVGLSVSLGLLGCGPSPQSEPTPPRAPAEADEHGGHTEHSDHDRSEHAHQGETSQADIEKAKAELAKLSPGDAALAAKQHACPVSGEMLGTMGAPINLDVKGRRVWIYCDGCKETLLANPDEHLAKLPEK